jgi:predicted oxidoreductase
VAPPVDKLAVALQRGGEGAIVSSLDEAAAFAQRHGFDGDRARGTIAEFNRMQRDGWERLEPLRVEHHRPIDTPPYYLLIVYPAITYTFGGLTIDTDARVLRAAGRPAPGLLAAGADAGDVYRTGYGGGLAQALVLGLRAAQTAGFGAQGRS